MGASQLPSVPENLPLSTIPVYQNQVTNTVVQPDPLLEKLALSKASSNLDALLTNVKPVEHDNPWDWVPDQPLKGGFPCIGKGAPNTCDTSRYSDDCKLSKKHFY